MNHQKATELAHQHVEWLMKIFETVFVPLLKEEFIHGYKHGYDQRKEDEK